MRNIDPDNLAEYRARYCQQGDPIGRAVSTEREPNTTSHFSFWCSGDERRLQLGNIVAAVGPDDLTFGIIIEMRAITDAQSFLADYLSHDYGRASAIPPSDLTELTIVKCAFLGNLSEQARPVGRAAIFFPNEDGLQKAMSLEQGGIPVGVFENGDGTMLPIALNQSYIVGPEGAHINIAGISGLASKTSFALLVMRSLLSTYERLAVNAQYRERVDQNLCIVLFNVKSRDLLYIDQPNPQLTDESDLARRSLQIYQQCEVPPEPFREVRYFAPSDPNNPQQPQSRRRNRRGDAGWANVEPICWEYEDIERYIPSFFDRETWNDQAISFWEIFREDLEQRAITTWQGFFQRLGQIANQVQPQRTGATLGSWQGCAGVTVLRWNFRRLPRQYRGLLAEQPIQYRPVPIKVTQGGPPSVLGPGRAVVIDIQRLPDNGQRLVFNKIVSGHPGCYGRSRSAAAGRARWSGNLCRRT